MKTAMEQNQGQNIEEQLLDLFRNFLLESQADRAAGMVSTHASLEKDLGIGSIERTELFHRIEQTFSIELPSELLTQTQTINDFLTAIKKANPPRYRQQQIKAPHLQVLSFDLSQQQTLIEILFKYNEYEPKRPHIYLQDANNTEKIISYGELYRQAKRIQQALMNQGIQKGDTVAIMLPTCAEFFYSFFGILLMGAIPVPLYPPLRASQIEQYVKREIKILQNAEISFLITFSLIERLNKLVKPFVNTLKGVMTATKLLETESQQNIMGSIKKNDAALIQYTSGSTGDPKGVLLSHENILTNIRLIGKTISLQANDTIVSWLPLYHDMGLIGAWLGSFYHGNPVIILSPLSFLARPERWLWTIHYYRATISAAPNFAYELCANKIKEAAIEGLDLSSWRLAFSGAEAIYPSTVRKFIKKFSPYHFKASSFTPAYGLAEASVGLTIAPINREPKIDKIDKEIFEKQQKAVSVTPASKTYLEFVSCGKLLPQHEIRLVNENDQPVPERQVGNLQFRGPSCMQEYYHNPQASQSTNHQGWWDSGDLAYCADGEFYITGRKKNLIVTAGRNLYPEEIEELVKSLSATIETVSAFGIEDMTTGTEKLIIIAETSEKKMSYLEEIATTISRKVGAHFSVSPKEVLLVPPKTIPKTASGKVQHSACRKSYLEKTLIKKDKPVWLQIANLYLNSTARLFKNFMITIAKVCYTSYAYVIFFLIFLPTWLTLFILPDRLNILFTRWSAKCCLSLIFCRIHLHNKDYLYKQIPVIYIANHSSYLDSLVLLAILPKETIITVKKELTQTIFLRNFIKKKKYLTIDRFDFSKSIFETEKMEKMLSENKSIFVFPEGTFNEAAGIKTFKLGAFKLAAETNTAICPIGIKGTRHILPAHQYLLRPKKIEINIGKLIIPEVNTWQDITKLRNLARHEIARLADEKLIE